MLRIMNKKARTAKGIKKQVIKKILTHDNYKEVLFNSEQMRHTMKTIRSKNHQLGSFELNKISLSCFDDKRCIHGNGITSYAYGHYKIKKGKRIIITYNKNIFSTHSF